MIRMLVLAAASLLSLVVGPAYAQTDDLSQQGTQSSASPSAVQASRPNIVVLFCDDLGYGDLGCYDHPHIKTPNLDRLAAQGIRFTSFYSAAPVCSASRAGLLTGRNPNRTGIYDWIPPSNGSAQSNAREQVHLRRQETTFSQKLRSAGYATFMAGKWHLNSRFNEPSLQPTPDHFGFDTWLATSNNARPNHAAPNNFVLNGKPIGNPNQYSCLFCAEQAKQWVTNHVEQTPEQPFLIFLPFHEPHEPVASPRILVKQYQPVAKSKDEATYFANVTNMDMAVGSLLKRLTELGLDDNTLVVFTSDNGPETLQRYKGANRSHGVTGGLRGMKLHTHEGGIRVPAIVRWPNKVKAGQTSDLPVWAIDLFPTICDVASIDYDQSRLDGQSLASLFRDKEKTVDDFDFERSKPMFWCFYNSLNPARVAMRSGRWKLLARIEDLPPMQSLTPTNLKDLKTAPLTGWELYDLETDRQEGNNLFESRSDVATEMQTTLLAMYRDLLNDSPTWTPKKK